MLPNPRSTHLYSFRARFQQIFYSSTLFPPRAFTQPTIRFELPIKFPHPVTKSTFNISETQYENTRSKPLFLDGLKSKIETAYAYYIDGILVFHCIRNNWAFVFTAKRMAIFACLSHFSQLPDNIKFFLLPNSFSSFRSLSDIPLSETFLRNEFTSCFFPLTWSTPESHLLGFPAALGFLNMTLLIKQQKLLFPKHNR